MLNSMQIRGLRSLAYGFIEALYNTILDKSDEALVRLTATFMQFVGYCEGILNTRLFNEESITPVIPTDIKVVTMMTIWVIGITRAVIRDDREQINSGIQTIVQAMKGNLDV